MSNIFSSLPITTTQAAVIKSLIENGNQFSYIRNPQPLTRAVAQLYLNLSSLPWHLDSDVEDYSDTLKDFTCSIHAVLNGLKSRNLVDRKITSNLHLASSLTSTFLALKLA